MLPSVQRAVRLRCCDLRVTAPINDRCERRIQYYLIGQQSFPTQAVLPPQAQRSSRLGSLRFVNCGHLAFSYSRSFRVKGGPREPAPTSG
ncbi:hypothetical protein A0H81_14931 [Grifola frondosa]|uniref:Uncharacterized protein n=1 Tax=Grifola frondosa TaxID=5627 RepID=A0A1C7LJX0_GRIFR|nr:hypothetical protein A0H81_14931 [Grifola frondosa]